MSLEISPFGQLSKKEIRRKISVIRQMILIYQQILLLITASFPKVVCHWTATDRDKTGWRAIEREHKRKGYPKSQLNMHIAYNTLIGEGYKIRARGYHETGEATGTFSQWSDRFHIDIAITGTVGQVMSDYQIKEFEAELAIIKKMYGGYILDPHSKYYPTECPGVSFRKHYQL